MITVYHHNPDTAELRFVERYRHFDSSSLRCWLALGFDKADTVTIVEESFTRAQIARALIGVKSP